MSRTHKSKHPKGWGYEYWSKRPGSIAGHREPGPWSKRINARLERRNNKRMEREHESSVEHTEH